MGDHAKPRLGLSMFDTIGVVCLLRYVHDLAQGQGGQVLRSPNYVHA